MDDLQKANNYAYSALIVQEQQTSRILDDCKEVSGRVESYYPHIYKGYYEETCTLFIDFILAVAATSSNRKAYQSVCRSVQTLKKAGYKIEAKYLVKELMQSYEKRPASVAELQKIM